MSCEGTGADAIIIQAVPNCLSLRIHIAESLATFAPVTIVQSVTGECASIYIGHIGEAHYVSTAQKQVSQIPNKNKNDMTLTGSKVFGWGAGGFLHFFSVRMFFVISYR